MHAIKQGLEDSEVALRQGYLHGHTPGRRRRQPFYAAFIPPIQPSGPPPLRC